MKPALKVLLGLLGGILPVGLFLLWVCSGAEMYCVIYPGIDTVYAPKYRESGFNKIKPGGTINEVTRLIGAPLWISTNMSSDNVEQFLMTQDQVERARIVPHVALMSMPHENDQATTTNFEVWHYTHDGKCRFGDFAWLGRFVVLSNKVVLGTSKRIFYD